jgi:hypothetical protein
MMNTDNKNLKQGRAGTYIRLAYSEYLAMFTDDELTLPNEHL